MFVRCSPQPADRPSSCRHLCAAFASSLLYRCLWLRPSFRSARSGLLLVALAVAVALVLHLCGRNANTSDARVALRLSISRFLNVGNELAADEDASQTPEEAESSLPYVSLAAHASRFAPIDSPTPAAANAHVFAAHVDSRQPASDGLLVVGIVLARNRPAWWPPAAARVYCHFWFPPPPHAPLLQQSVDDTSGFLSSIAQTSDADANDANDVLVNVSRVPFTAAASVSHVMQYYHETCAP